MILTRSYTRWFLSIVYVCSVHCSIANNVLFYLECCHKASLGSHPQVLISVFVVLGYLKADDIT